MHARACQAAETMILVTGPTRLLCGASHFCRMLAELELDLGLTGSE